MNTQRNNPKIVLSGGGTGGHIFPLMEIGKYLNENYQASIIYYGSGAKIELDQTRYNNLPYRKILCGKFRRNLSIKNFLWNTKDFFLFLFGSIQSFFLLLVDKPDVIFSKGGYVSLPVVIAGRILNIPIVIHESDIMPGLANRLAFKSAKRFCVGWPLDAYSRPYLKKAIYCGVPIKKEFFSAKKTEKHILIFGGSQGAQKINEHFFRIGKKILLHHKVVHITGEYDFKKSIKFRDSLPPKSAQNYEIIEFSNDMPRLIADSKLVISRCGANSIFEIASAGKPSILIPISPNVTAHQIVNAAYIRLHHYGEIFNQEDKSSVLFKLIQKSLREKNSSIKNLGFPKSVEKISQIIMGEFEAQNFKKNKKIHLIGIGGVSMSAIAKILSKMKISVTGSDIRIGGHRAENISPDLDLVAFTSAAGENTKALVEHKQAKKYNIPIIRRVELISMIASNKSVIAVSGMHGKTTISSIIARILECSDYDPSFLIGADSTYENPTAKLSKGEHFVIEACEYDDSFLDLAPEIAIISNIEKEHLDYFKGGLNEIKKHFGQFVRRIRPGGALVYCIDSQATKEVVSENLKFCLESNISLISYGMSDVCDFKVNRYRVDNGYSRFSVHNESMGRIELESKITGEHFALNLTCGLAVGNYLGISTEYARYVAKNFSGAKRRFTFVGEKKGVIVYDDYGHHPTEIKFTLKAMKEKFSEKRSIIIFQPHQQSRFNEFYNDFKKVFEESKINKLIILPVYKVEGRDEEPRHTSEELVKSLSKTKDTLYFENYSQVCEYLLDECRSGDVVMTIGATSVFKIGEEFLNKK